MGLLPMEFYSMTLSEYEDAVAGYLRKQTRQWEHTRFIAMMVMNTVTTKPIKDPREFMPLPTDDEMEVRKMDGKTVKELMEKMLMNSPV
jgi:hypothetical protein